MGLSYMNLQIEAVNKQMTVQIMLQAKMLAAMTKSTKVVKEQADKVNEVKKEMYSLADAQKTAADTTSSFSRSFALAADGVGKHGKRWTMFSRILSGSPIWKLQNYVRAVGQAMHGYYTRAEKAAEITNAQAKAFSELQKHIITVEEQLTQLKTKGVANHEALMESNQEYANTFNALAETEIGIEGAKRAAKARTLSQYTKTHKTLSDNLKAEGKSLQKAMAVELKLRNKGDLIERKDQLKQYKVLHNRRKAEMKKVKKLQKAVGKGTATKDQLAAAKATEKSTRGKMGGFSTKSGGGMADLLKFQKENSKVSKLLMWSGITPLKKMGKGIFRLATDSKARKKFIKKIGKVFNLIGKIVKIGLSYAMYAMLFIIGAFVVFAIVKKIMEKVDVMGILMETFEGIFDGAMVIFEGVQKIFGAFFGEGTLTERFSLLLEGFVDIFAGLGGILWSLVLGVGKILWGATLGFFTFVWKFYTQYLWELLAAIPTILIDLATYIFGKVPDVVKTAISDIISGVSTAIGNIKDALISGVSTKIDNLKTAIGKKFSNVVLGMSNIPKNIKTKLKEIWNDYIWSWLKPLKDGVVAGFFAAFDAVATVIDNIKKLIDDVIDALTFWHTGGVTSNSLNFVGERGPELVNLPRGTRVHSKAETTEMLKSTQGHNIKATASGVTNNINVSVNGRLGASDAELRDIAKKVGRMVSTEINRTTSSSTNVRY